jgi:hypothetical protein
MQQCHHEHDPLQPHAHEPNPDPPSTDPTFTLTTPDGRVVTITLAQLRGLPPSTLPNCYIVSTGHGTSGPFAFTGAKLVDLVQTYTETVWSQVEVVSGDGFGNRLTAEELLNPDPAGPILLAYAIDGTPMTRAQGLVRLVVPSETDDALRQVKWIGQINVRP